MLLINSDVVLYDLFNSKLCFNSHFEFRLFFFSYICRFYVRKVFTTTVNLRRKNGFMSPQIYIPNSFNITHSENHWANEDTMIHCITHIIGSYVEEIKDEFDLPLAQKALVIFDCFRGQITEQFLAALESKNLLYATIPQIALINYNRWT